MSEFSRMGDSIKDAILTIMKYIKATTGTEPTQEEVAELLESYFIINEVANQAKYQLKKEAEKGTGNQVDARGPHWRLNLKSGPGPNILARAGVFHRSIKVAIEGIRNYMIKSMGIDPDYDVIAKSLQSNFILSEIKNQFDYQRMQAQRKDDPKNENEYEL